MNTSVVPAENVEVYGQLYCIENALRELIIETLQAIEGPQWYKRRLPGDTLEKYKDGVRYEKSLRWYQLVPHHPIYYVDFPDLKKVIEREDNWNDAFKSIFLRKDVFSNTLSGLEPIRNKVAHNRRATKRDIDVVAEARAKLCQFLGEDRFTKLSNRCTRLTDLEGRLKALRQEYEDTFCICRNCAPLKKLVVWESTRNEWWFDETYLGHTVDAIQSYFGILSEYLSLPRTRGSGHKIEEWVKSNDIEAKYDKAKGEFSALLGSGGENGSHQVV
ncbi:MAG: Swt1 family HEPN domain-containing protein [Chloroflexota bacterium]